jgi:hypothetical protein
MDLNLYSLVKIPIYVSVFERQIVQCKKTIFYILRRNLLKLPMRWLQRLIRDFPSVLSSHPALDIHAKLIIQGPLAHA